MHFEDFIEFCGTKGFGIVTLNTYCLRGTQHCSIIATQDRNTGQFVRGECISEALGSELDIMVQAIENTIMFG